MLFTPMGMDDDSTRERVEQVSRLWWVLLVTGLVTVGLGVTIMAVDWTAQGLALVVGTLFVLRGIFRAVSPALSRDARRFDIATGVLWGLVGVAFMVWPEPTLLVLAIFIGASLLVDGIMHIAGAIQFRRESGSWWISALAGLAISILGIVAMRRPELTFATLILLSGLWAIVVGAAEIISAFVLRHMARDLERSIEAGEMEIVEETIVLDQPLLSADQQLGLVDQLHLSGGLTDTEYGRLRSRLMGATATADAGGSSSDPI